MILLINICKEDLHINEFVYPIGDILIKNKIKGFIRKYDCIKKKDLQKASKIIICGTSLQDNDFLKHINKFKWIKDYDKPILGICGGMHVIHLIHHGKKQKNKIIGNEIVDFKKPFLGLIGKKEVYNLHQYYYESKEFIVYGNKQASKHKSKSFYGVLFHPEVRNKELILSFAKVH